jgi:hypothetical protein
MPRTARVAPRDYVYHVLTRGNNRQNIFKDEEDYTKYIEILKRYKEKYQYKLYHYVLMIDGDRRGQVLKYKFFVAVNNLFFLNNIFGEAHGTAITNRIS